VGCREEGGHGERCRGRRLEEGVAEKVAELLLFLLVPAAARGEVRNAEKQRRPWRWSAGTASPASSNGEEGD
jgi:hypothetical protein